MPKLLLGLGIVCGFVVGFFGSLDVIIISSALLFIAEVYLATAKTSGFFSILERAIRCFFTQCVFPALFLSIWITYFLSANAQHTLLKNGLVSIINWLIR